MDERRTAPRSEWPGPPTCPQGTPLAFFDGGGRKTRRSSCAPLGIRGGPRGRLRAEPTAGAGPAGSIREGEIVRMIEYDLDLPRLDGWATSVAVADELVRSLGAEVVEYDVTPSGGTITMHLPGRMYRTVRTMHAS